MKDSETPQIDAVRNRTEIHLKCDKCENEIQLGEGRVPVEDMIFHKECAPTEVTQLRFNGEGFELIDKVGDGFYIWKALSGNSCRIIPDWIHSAHKNNVLSEGNLCHFLYYPNSTIECHSSNGLEDTWRVYSNSYEDFRAFVADLPHKTGVDYSGLLSEFDSIAELRSDIYENECNKLRFTQGIGDGTITHLKNILSEPYETSGDA